MIGELSIQGLSLHQQCHHFGLNKFYEFILSIPSYQRPIRTSSNLSFRHARNVKWNGYCFVKNFLALPYKVQVIKHVDYRAW